MLFSIALSVATEAARDNKDMPTRSIQTDVFISKAEALNLLEKELGLSWVLDDPTEVTLVLEQGAWLSIEVPKFGEDLPLTLDCHHDDEAVLVQVVENLAAELAEKLGWETRAF
jgi:hypothetical protein